MGIFDDRAGAGRRLPSTWFLPDGPASVQHFAHLPLHLLPRQVSGEWIAGCAAIPASPGDLPRIRFRFARRMLPGAFGRAATPASREAAAARIAARL